MRVRIGKRTASSIVLNAPITKGGEGEIYRLSRNELIKIYKSADHDDIMTVEQRDAAKKRLNIVQTKLSNIPKLPSNCIVPNQLVYNESGSLIIGFTMREVENSVPLAQYMEPNNFRKNIDNNVVVRLFRDIRMTYAKLHSRNVLVGDNNPYNILVSNKSPFFIDVDAYVIPGYDCMAYTIGYLDPLHSEKDDIRLIKRYNVLSDFYAYSLMLFESLLLVHLYGGAYRNKQHKISEKLRPLHRISVFNSNVIYPKCARHYSCLSDDVLQYFYNLVEKDHREVFPEKLLNTMEWKFCSSCNSEHSRNICPVCSSGKPKITLHTNRQDIIVSNVFYEKDSQILSVEYYNGKLCYIYKQNDKLFRESGVLIGSSPSNIYDMKFDLNTQYVYIGRGNVVDTYQNSIKINSIPVSTIQGESLFAAAETGLFYINFSNLYYSPNGGYERKIGAVFPDSTKFWVNNNWGFGYYMVSSTYNIGFVFNTMPNSMLDSMKFSIPGRILQSYANIGNNLVWFFVKYEVSGAEVIKLFVIDRQCRILYEEDNLQGEWANCDPKHAINNFIFSSTDDGIEKVELKDGRLIWLRYSQTKDFVERYNRLFVSTSGIYVVSNNIISTLSLK